MKLKVGQKVRLTTDAYGVRYKNRKGIVKTILDGLSPGAVIGVSFPGRKSLIEVERRDLA